ncbi:MAG TPA: hypothetical protein VFM55_04335 [Micromonosporaceae bacterium]|nr:hypothetical protein [Micromonosporaceae bacterium]
MRFEVSRVMDTIEQRLTTDVTLAQAVADLGEIARCAELDQGSRPVNLLRIGIAVDALSRYLVDEGAMLYAVAGRELLSESALTSKERMVLGRWLDDGLIEVTAPVADRPVEVADLTGLPLIAVRAYPEFAGRFPWLRECPERLLRLVPRSGGAVLSPMDLATPDPQLARAVAVGKAPVRAPQPPASGSVAQQPLPSGGAAPSAAAPGTREEAAPEAPEPLAESQGEPAPEPPGEQSEPEAQSEPEQQPAAAEQHAVAEQQAVPEDLPKPAVTGTEPVTGADPVTSAEPINGAAPFSSTDAGAEPAAAPATEPAAESPAADETAEKGAVGEAAGPAGAPAQSSPVELEAFVTRGAQRLSHTLVVRRRFVRAQPSGMGVSLMARHWRCTDPDCPVFGERRLIGQPVPLMRNGVATCPRHGDPVCDIGPRPPAYAVSLVVDDLARRRFVVRAGNPVTVGRGGEGDPDGLVATGSWLHEAAAAWVAPAHVRLEAGEDGLVVTDVSENGTVVWRRSGPDDAGTSTWLYGSSYTLGDWDTVELYTGVELVRGDHRLTTTVGRVEPSSVLVDAPTAAHRQLA